MHQTRFVSPRRVALTIAALVATLVATFTAPAPVRAQAQAKPAPTAASTTAPADARLEALKREVLQDVDARRTFTQQMVDQIFSFGELGFQEVETSKYLVSVLRKNGFTVKEGIAGIPTAWVATWGSGKPVISLGSDVDDIPQAS
ncbi:MAG TPA: hypothetical protein VGT98_15830, partial [Candidatus Elarobacter sp.]|nr:hypothetical protein [Candidatus Elarobacter sp.]